MEKISLILLFVLILTVLPADAYDDGQCHLPPRAQPKNFKENCGEIDNSNTTIEGVYKLQSKGIIYEAYCQPDPQFGPSWTIILRRGDGNISFDRDWIDYENGFGDKKAEYWLGLKQIHAITQSQDIELWVQLKNYNGSFRFARYSYFAVRSKELQYELTLNGYYGDAGDSLAYHNGMKFYTYDRDHNDCAKNEKGGWWMNNCTRCNLNGEYRRVIKPNGSGIKWESFMGSEESVQYAHMALRAIKYE